MRGIKWKKFKVTIVFSFSLKRAICKKGSLFWYNQCGKKKMEAIQTS